MGTLYRRFGDRDDLLRAVSIDTMRHLVTLAERAIAEQPDAWQALSWYLRQCLDLHIGVLSRRSLMELLGRMVGDAESEGLLRPDVDAGDIALLAGVQLHQPALPFLPFPQRFATLLLDGLRADKGRTPLPGGPITAGDVEPR